MIGNEVQDHFEITGVRGRDETVGVGERAEERIDVAIVADVVTEIGHRRRVDRRKPNGVDPKFAEVGEVRDDARQIADAVAIRIGERSGIDLIHDAIAPPDAFRKVHRVPVPAEAEPQMGKRRA
jgi:hypothetical protein